MNRGNPFKRRRYWREQKDCPCPVAHCEASECEERREAFSSGGTYIADNPSIGLVEYYKRTD